MKAEQAREIAMNSIMFPNGMLNEIHRAAQCGDFRIFWPKRELSDWAISELEKNGYQVIERAFEYEINWDE